MPWRCKAIDAATGRQGVTESAPSPAQAEAATSSAFEPGDAVTVDGRPAILEELSPDGALVRYEDAEGNVTGRERVEASHVSPMEEPIPGTS